MQLNELCTRVRALESGLISVASSIGGQTVQRMQHAMLAAEQKAERSTPDRVIRLIDMPLSFDANEGLTPDELRVFQKLAQVAISNKPSPT